MLLGFLPIEEELLDKMILNCNILASLRIGKKWCYGWEVLSRSFILLYKHLSNKHSARQQRN